MKRNHIGNNRRLLFVLSLAAILAAIICLKSNSPKTTTDNTGAGADSTGARAVAVPDTSVTKDVMPAITETPAPAASDSVGRDTRPADEAGAEDGYWNGYYDGVAGREADEHDVTSSFPTQKEREAYATNYTENYSRGYEEGSAGKKAADRQ